MAPPMRRATGPTDGGGVRGSAAQRHGGEQRSNPAPRPPAATCPRRDAGVCCSHGGAALLDEDLEVVRA